MSATPPSEEFVTDSDGAAASPAAEVAEPPRTVKRRLPRPGAEPRSELAADAEVSDDAEAPDGAEAHDGAEIPDAVESARVEDHAPDDGSVQAGPEAASASESEPEAAFEAETHAESAPQTPAVPASTAAATEPAAEPERQIAPARIEVPVPSVVRARERAEIAAGNPVVLRAESLTKSYGQVLAAADVSFEVHAGSLTGVVGPNGAGKTTVLSMISGLNRPTSGRISVRDIDVWGDGPAAKRVIGSLPDRLRLFDRLSGGQLLYYAGVLQGLDQQTVAGRAAELAAAFGLESALDRPVSDYSAGMQKKIGLACSMIHAPEVLVLDEPYETIDPVSASNVTEILEKYVAGGGSVVMSSHSLDLIQRICDHVVVIVDGGVVAQGTVDEVRGGVSLEERFKHLTRPDEEGKGLEWLRGSSDSE